MQRGGHKRAGGADCGQLVKVGRTSNTAGCIDRSPRCPLDDCCHLVDIRTGAGADPGKRHHDNAGRP
jgi:hypothetical protein